MCLELRSQNIIHIKVATSNDFVAKIFLNVLLCKSQDTLLPPPHGRIAPCLVAPPIAFYDDEVCAREINFDN